MQVQNDYSNMTTKGIELSSTNKKKVGTLVNQLQRTGFNCLGQKTIYCNNKIGDIIKNAQNIRQKAYFAPRKFGILNFVWSNKCYLVASPEYEFLLFPLIKQYDKNAKINIAI